VGEQQLKVQPMRREGWTPQKLDEVASTSAWCWSAIREADHRHHEHISEKKKWWYAYSLLGMSNLKDGTKWHEGWKPKDWSEKRESLLDNSSVNTLPQ
jgi:hypothetical protein